MAIVEMKRIALLAMKQDREALLTALQRLGCVQVTETPEELAAYAERAAGTQVAEELARLKWAIDLLKRYDTQKAPMFGGKREVAEAETDAAFDGREETFKLVGRLEALERRMGELRSAQARCQAQIDQLAPWLALDIPLAAVAPTHSTAQWLGTLPLRALEEAQARFADMPVVLETLSSVREGACVHVTAHRAAAQEADALLKEGGFVPAQLAGMTDTPSGQTETLKGMLADIANEQETIENEMRGMAARLDELRLLCDALNIRRERAETIGRCAATGSAFYLRGWVPAAMGDKVRERLRKISPSCAVEITDPAQGEEPPVKLQNSKWIMPFESVTEGFALPAYGGVDPTAVMAPFYACFFGMMVSDAGYGLLMAILIPLVIWKFKIKRENAKLMWVLAMGGALTVVWGLIYNTAFGFNPLPEKFWLLDAVNNSIPVMVVCIAIGVIHLFAGLGMGAYLNFKRGKPLDALYDQFSWIFLLCGLGMLALPATSTIGVVLAALGGGLILVMAGRGKSNNPIKRLISGLGALYGISSWLSDILSYMRLFGMGLTTGVIGMVINMLVGMVFQNGIIGIVIGSVLFVGAHLFNLLINALGAYVHACRLQYIEFFGKFYEEGGKPFAPLRNNTKYVSVRTADQP